MSTTLPTQEQASQAYSYMIDQIHVPAFFEKLAANGIEPRNQSEAKQLLQLGAVLANAESDGRVKQASQENQFLSHCLDKLNGNQQPDVDSIVKQSADKLVSDNELAKTAALVYAHAASGGELAPAEEEQPSEQ